MRLEFIRDEDGPSPLGSYSHASVYGDLVFTAGIAGRDPKTNGVPGLELDEHGKRVSYDIRAETRLTLLNLRGTLEAAGSDLEHVLEVCAYLLDMKGLRCVQRCLLGVLSEVQARSHDDRRVVPSR